MPTLSGIYISSSGRALASNKHGELMLLPIGQQPVSLRTDSEFWLCRNDGIGGKSANPNKVNLSYYGNEYHIWVEPRGLCNGSNQYGLVIIPPGGEYSNRFLAVNERGELEILDSWTNQAKFQCIE